MHEHGRRMISAMVFVEGIPASQERLLRAFAVLPRPLKIEMRNSLCGCHWDGTLLQSALNHGLINQIAPSAPEFEPFLHFVRGDPSSPLDAADLAHPALTEESLVLLKEESPPKAITRTAISLNPNAPANYKFSGIKDGSPPAFMVTACARHGDTFNPHIVDVLKKGLFSALHDNDERNANRNSICARPNLSPEIVLALAAEVTGAAYWDLMLRPEHRKICEVQAGQPPGFYFGADGLRLHPEITEPVLEKIFDLLDPKCGAPKIRDWELGMAQVAAHPNSSEALLSRLLSRVEKKMLTRLLGEFRDTHVEEKVTEALIRKRYNSHETIAYVADCSPAALERAYQEMKGRPKDAAVILSHKNFPWKNHSEAEVVAGMREDVILAIRAARLLSDGGSNEALSARNRGDALTLLFDQRLSSRRVEMIAAKYPDCAVFAALHPNAESITVPQEHEAIVERFRPKRHPVALGGRSGRSQVSDTIKLEL